MIFRRLLGEIMIDLGFITRDELEQALERQEELYRERVTEGPGSGVSLVSGRRVARKMERVPLLGVILNYMGFATMEQIEIALRDQEQMTEVYKRLDSEKLGIAIETSSLVNSTLNLSEVLSIIMKYVDRVTNSYASSLMLLDEESGELVFSIPTGPKADSLKDIRIPPGKGIAGWVAQKGRPLIVPNARDDPRFYPEIDKISGIETKSILCVPLKSRTRLIGVIEAINKIDGSSFTQEDAYLLSIFSTNAALAIENARLYTELKESREDELEVQKKLHEYEKFRALAQMAAGVAHDFNNLLMNIQGNTSLVLLDMDESHPHYERLKSIEKSVFKGAEVNKKLLGFARGGKYEVKTADLNQIVEKSARIFGRSKEGLRIHTKYQENIWKVEVDQGQIEHVLLNLYMNAWQAMPGGGDLYIETKNVALSEDFVRKYKVAPGHYVMVSVRDTGMGMDEATQKRVFDPFFTTREIARGTGLGLASAYGIIRNHRGIINLQSRKGEGTTFRIYLPALRKEAARKMDNSKEIFDGQRTVLLVDDEDIILDVGRQMLERMGFQVLVAKSGEEAVEIYDQHKSQIDLVILDMIMPDMNGGEVFDKIRGLNPSAKVLLSSGYSLNGQASEVLKKGCNGFIQKPFGIQDLDRKIKEVLGEGGT
ncbi:MAG: response regulator [Deltaproteobacteria bacterium]|nr:response regulator [Deltaproteobacteria bacterium]